MNKIIMNKNDNQHIKFAVFAGGCFWCTEDELRKAQGVIDVISGYIGGNAEDANYKEVSKGTTKHFEAVKIIYDETLTSFDNILKSFWATIDPTDEGGQHFDRGNQYKTAIFYNNEEEKNIATQQKLNIEKQLNKQVYTQILPQSEFFPAEDYHQKYSEKNNFHYQSYKKGSKREETLSTIWNKIQL